MPMASTRAGDGLERGIPEQAGIRSGDIHAFLQDAAKCGVELHTFMLYRAGHVVAEGSWWPYRPTLPHMLHSATKSFLSAAVGLAIHENYFKLDSRVVDIFSDRLPADVSPGLASLTVEHLLTQTSGHGLGVSGGEWRGIKTSWIDQFFTLPIEHEPGTKFVYTSATSFMLSAIISKTTGQTVRDFLEPRFFAPLGIKLLAWDVGPDNICPGGNGISCLPSDFLKLGILHLQKGKWEGRQILPEAWVAASTTSQRGNLHGYHWWTDVSGNYYASGMFGQYCVVFPEHDAVLVTTGAVPEGTMAQWDVIWRHFPKLFNSLSNVVDIEHNSEQQLTDTIVVLRVLPHFETTTVDASALTRVSRERYSAKENDDGVLSFALDFTGEDHCIFHVQDGRGFHQVRVGLTDWLESETTLSGAKLHHGYEPARLRVVAGGRWSSQNTFEIAMQFNETAFRDECVITFLNNYAIASLDRSVNVNSFATRRPTVFGAILKSGNELTSSEFLSVAKQRKEYSTATTTIGELLDNPKTRQILVEEIPQLIESPRLEKTRRYTLDAVARHGNLEGLDLTRVNEKLALLSTAD